jgi:NitT/TauT family transport system ATP-binding protein
VVDGVTIHVDAGEIVGLLGPNGAGKTTSFNMVVGLVRPDVGKVNFQGQDVTRMAMHTRARLGVGYLTQEPSVFRKLSVEDNLRAILETVDCPTAERATRLNYLLDELDLARLSKSLAYQLSGGEKRRLEITRALVTSPKLLLMDEPFAALDEQTRLLLGDKITQIQQDLNQTTLLITHNLTEAVQLSDRIVVMTYRPGKVKRIVDIKLPRPRTSDVVSSDAFGHYVAEIWSDLREEASRGMADSESAQRGGSRG